MATALIRIRLKQLARQSTNSAFMYGLLLIVSALVAGVCFIGYSDAQITPVVCGAVILVVVSMHFSRSDSLFVYRQLAQPQQAIFMEYLFFTAPLSIPALLTPHWYCSFIITALLYAIAQIKHQKKQRVRLKKLSAVISPSHFELLSGFRKSLFPVLICYILAFAFSWVRILPLFFLWLITVQIMSFYSRSEPLEMLRANDKPAAVLLRSKLLRHSMIIAILYLPVAILNACFVEDFWWINLLVLALQVTLICFAICYKYSVYRPKTSDNGSILFGLVAFSGIVPVLLPVPAIMCMSYYFRARQNLNDYLND
jgi:hypothetical protein